MRLIDADAIDYDEYWNRNGEGFTIDVCQKAQRIIDEQPTIPSAEAVQGEWIGYNADKEDWLRTDGTPIFLVCDKCHGTVINNGSAHWNFCPNCGARMKGAEHETD